MQSPGLFYGPLLTVLNMSRGLDERSKKFIDAVQADLRALSNETRRKFQPVKEVRDLCDAGKLPFICYLNALLWNQCF